MKKNKKEESEKEERETDKEEAGRRRVLIKTGQLSPDLSMGLLALV